MLNIQMVIDYLKHWTTAKTRHGVHSPFVYQLVDKVIYDFHAKTDYLKIEELRAVLLKDKRVIEVTDLGAGSAFNNHKKKQVSLIARYALKSSKLAQLLYRLAKHFSPGVIIELGTCLGITTAYLAKAAPTAKVISVEGCPQTSRIAAENLNQLGIVNTQLLVGNFDTVLPEIINQADSLDFIFIDGNHRKDATLNYFNWCLPKLNANGILIFDDIYWSKGMKEAWKEIKDHPQVSVTIDLFWIGLVFIKEGQVKEDFKIRF
ncbi:MAG: class I SAM-dependent methyltransferase [Flavobacterium sp.]|nr:class I SAM-dependent methyltransferase [Pedobacter sp.]